MAEMTHTPGPWRVGDAGHTVFGPPNGNPSPKTVAHSLSRADARLVAAAPEMLAALDMAAKVVRTARQYFPKSVKASDRFELELTGATISKALAKAEGSAE